MSEDSLDKCGDVAGRRHFFATDRQAAWIPDEKSYQVWGVCKNVGCKFSAWFVLTPVPIYDPFEAPAPEPTA